MSEMDPPAEGANENEEDPMMSNKDESSKKASTAAPSEKEEEHDMCCCCICQCSTEETKNLSCCACFPIKCGLIVVGIIYCTLTVAMFIELFYGFINEQIHWWYPVVGILLMVPLIIGLCFYIRFFTKDDSATRGRLYVCCILLIISFSLLAIWNICYFQYLYKYDVVYAGADVIGYVTSTKKAFMVWFLFVTLIINFSYAYFMCVASAYSKAMDGGEPEGLDVGMPSSPF